MLKEDIFEGEEIIVEEPVVEEPMLVNSRTYVPARAIAESYDCTVEWDNDTRTVTIRSK